MRLIIIITITCSSIVFAVDSLETPDTLVSARKANTLSVCASILLKGYKKGISNLETHECPMTPSCSEFALEAFRRTNPLKALFLAVDRLTRDNSFAKYYYPKNEKGKLVDPLDRYIKCDKKPRRYY